jgi:integrase
MIADRRLLDSTVNLKHRAVLGTLCSTGMRAAELRQLKVSDIDGPRGLVLIRHGKGDRQRYVMLSTQPRDTLRSYWRWRKPQDWLFPSAQRPTYPLDTQGFAQRQPRISPAGFDMLRRWTDAGQCRRSK